MRADIFHLIRDFYTITVHRSKISDVLKCDFLSESRERADVKRKVGKKNTHDFWIVGIFPGQYIWERRIIGNNDMKIGAPQNCVPLRKASYFSTGT